GAPHKYDQGHILPNVVAVYDGEKVTEKFVDEKEARWIDRSVKATQAVCWVLKGSKPLVIGVAGDPTVEARVKEIKERNEQIAAGKLDAKKVEVAKKEIDDQKAWWEDGAVKSAKGDYWVIVEPEAVVVGKVGDAAVESKLQNPERAMINLPAIIIVFIVTAVLVKGIKESAGFNALMVGIKVAAVLFVILVGAFYINPANWSRDFAP